MKKLISILFLLTSFNAYSHCGSCGVGGEKEGHEEAHMHKDGKQCKDKECKEKHKEEEKKAKKDKKSDE